MAALTNMSVGEVVDILVPTDPIVVTENNTARVLFDNHIQTLGDMDWKVLNRRVKHITNDSRTMIVVVYEEGR